MEIEEDPKLGEIVVEDKEDTIHLMENDVTFLLSKNKITSDESDAILIESNGLKEGELRLEDKCIQR